MKTILEALPAIGAKRTDIENWLPLLRTHYEPTVRGRARRYSKKNVLELATVAALVRAGMPVSSAIVFAEPMSDGLQHEAREWAVFPAGDYARVVWTNDLSSAVADFKFIDGVAPAFSIVCLGEVRRRVDALFNRAKVEA